ncbi:hypothetical protein KC333_g2059 [Hortaea werneckii]|nr:hypothetical protein KC333_g2059 [Hortaea werneckii]KAI7315935.1 hypothetical protein KC326_g4523 [Hortaea werneckii]
MAPMKTKASAADLEKLRWCRQPSLAIKAEEALNATLTDTNELHISVNLTDAADVTCQIGTQAAVEANIRSAYWLVTANEIVRTAEIDAKKYSLQTIAG